MNIIDDPKFAETLKEEEARLEGIRNYCKSKQEWELASLVLEVESKLLDVRAELIRRATK